MTMTSKIEHVLFILAGKKIFVKIYFVDFICSTDRLIIKCIFCSFDVVKMISELF